MFSCHISLVTLKTLVKSFIDTLICFILTKKLKEVLHVVPSVRFAMQGKLLAMQSELKKSYPLERRGGSFKCWGRWCQVCLNLTETETFTSASTNQTYKIDHDFNCNECFLIYLSTCKICYKYYVGQSWYLS